ncbi:unnamed protein product [Fusarium graminearum]|uniref:Uncharacterized protein n=1 Tax=Gibberella zeae TaxID=5518 RepID=A0A9N8RAT3_GIBZA|nr:unnamed protein product [Fusarium graminearum]
MEKRKQVEAIVASWCGDTMRRAVISAEHRLPSSIAMTLDIAHITENISTTGFWIQEDAHIGALIDSIIRTDS